MPTWHSKLGGGKLLHAQVCQLNVFHEGSARSIVWLQPEHEGKVDGVANLQKVYEVVSLCPHEGPDYETNDDLTISLAGF